MVTFFIPVTFQLSPFGDMCHLFIVRRGGSLAQFWNTSTNSDFEESLRIAPTYELGEFSKPYKNAKKWVLKFSKFWVSKQDLIGRKLWDATSPRPSSLDSTQFLQWTVSYWLVRTRSGVRTNFHQRARTLNSNKVTQITHPHVFSSYESIEWQTFSHTKCHNGLVFDHNNTNDLTVYIFI